MKKPLVIIAIVLALGVAAFIVFKKFQPEQVACTMEARVCPDGSYVGRIPPLCQFAPCPGPSQGVGGGKEENKQEDTQENGVQNDDIRVTAPSEGNVIKSPLTVTGEARGTWYFEASFPVRLIDGNGKELAVVPAQAKGDWMTTDFVPFEATLTFATPATATGTLVLEKDNPSGLPEHTASLRIPIRFR